WTMNVESMQNLYDNMSEYGYDLTKIPFIVQYNKRGVRQVALVVLDDERNLGQVVTVLRHVVVQVLHRLDVRLHALDLAVGHEHDAIHALENQLAARVVVYLTRHRVEMEPGLEAPDGAQVHRQEVEEQRALGLCGERDHLAARVGRHLTVNVLEVGRLAAQARAVVHELAVDLAGRVIDHRHGTRVLLAEEFVNFVF